MKDINIVHCFFEQSGVFKKAFFKNNITAFDYDIKNEYCETDFVVDLFAEIEKAYNNENSIFDSISTNDLIFAFFPCIYFCECNQFFFRADSRNYKGKGNDYIFANILERNEKRAYYYSLLIKLCYIAESKNFRLIVENPYSRNHYLYNNFPYRPAVIDYNRNEKGDYFKKSTQYFFINCEVSTKYNSRVIAYKAKKIRSLTGHCGSGCGKERSEISPIYAECFINDYILSKKSQYTESNLFDI